MSFKRPVEPVTVSPDDGHGERYTHPSFGQIRASRVQGHRNLYGSDVEHHGFISITLSKSSLRRNLSNDWHFGEKELFEVHLSEAQWATFVSAMNIGSGVPCTIDYISGKQPFEHYAPEVPILDKVGMFKKEHNERLEDGLAAVQRAMELLEQQGIPKGKANIIRQELETAQRQLKSNVGYVADQFIEFMEDTVEKAKADAHGYITNAVTRAGLNALGAPDQPSTMLRLDDPQPPEPKLISGEGRKPLKIIKKAKTDGVQVRGEAERGGDDPEGDAPE